MANKSFNISDLANQNGETVQLHSEHDKSIDYTILCLSLLAVVVNTSFLFSMYKNNTMKNRIFIAAYAIGTSTTGLAFAIGYYYRIINHDIRFQTTSLRICMTRTPHISLYVVGDTLMAISILCMSAERLLSVHLAMHLRHLNSKIHLLLTVTTFLWPTIHLLAVWFSIADPEHWNSKVPAVCFLRTTVPKRMYAIHNFISCISGAVSVVFLITAVLCIHYRKAEIASIRSVQVKREAKIMRNTILIVFFSFSMITVPTIVHLIWLYYPKLILHPELSWVFYVSSLSIYAAVYLLLTAKCCSTFSKHFHLHHRSTNAISTFVIQQ